MSKYDPLLHYLTASTSPHLKLSFREIEKILGIQLPPSARRYNAWWSNELNGRHVQAASWLNASYATEDLDLGSETVWFRQIAG